MTIRPQLFDFSAQIDGLHKVSHAMTEVTAAFEATARALVNGFVLKPAEVRLVFDKIEQLSRVMTESSNAWMAAIGGGHGPWGNPSSARAHHECFSGHPAGALRGYTGSQLRELESGLAEIGVERAKLFQLDDPQVWKEVRNAIHAALRKAHPDKHVGATPDEATLFNANTQYLNDLRDKLERARYALIAQRGGSTAS